MIARLLIKILDTEDLKKLLKVYSFKKTTGLRLTISVLRLVGIRSEIVKR